MRMEVDMKKPRAGGGDDAGLPRFHLGRTVSARGRRQCVIAFSIWQSTNMWKFSSSRRRQPSKEGQFQVNNERARCDNSRAEKPARALRGAFGRRYPHLRSSRSTASAIVGGLDSSGRSAGRPVRSCFPPRQASWRGSSWISLDMTLIAAMAALDQTSRDSA